MTTELPTRKPLRLKNYDYSRNGAYFITFCTHNRQKTLSNVIVGAIHESPAIELTERGRMVEEAIEQLPDRLGVRVDDYVIMPNHVHLMLTVEIYEPERAIRESPLRRSAISKAVGYIRMNASKHIRSTFGDEKIWQRGFNDHIVRNQRDYNMISEYISANPALWQKDCFYSE